MRVYGRTYDLYGNPTWQVVETDANGQNDAVYATALCQCLKLNTNESPFWANYGIPASQSVQTQIFPDIYVALIQQFFARFFIGLFLAKIANGTATQPATPQYSMKIVPNFGAILPAVIAQ